MDERIQKVLDSLASDIRRKLTLSELAGWVNLSVPRLVQLFKAGTGMSPGQYLTKLRIERAGELLATTDLSVKQVMAESGFRDKSNFLRQFKKAHKATPTEYRASLLTRRPAGPPGKLAKRTAAGLEAVFS